MEHECFRLHHAAFLNFPLFHADFELLLARWRFQTQKGGWEEADGSPEEPKPTVASQHLEALVEKSQPVPEPSVMGRHSVG